uniref:DNA-directed RNA polymerase n=1 Tax=viral metagenome TaxID=1070528 RepID=A0A6C0HRK2_9ZZZZ
MPRSAIGSQYVNSSRIIGIQFSIMSPEEIRNGSVVEITTKETYMNNKPVPRGIFDPRMGVGEPGAICPTDGLDYMQTPGYFGHLELARPVFYIQFLNTVLKIMRCVCFKCSKILINKEKYKQALEMTNEHRWKYVFAIASKVKRCGEDTHDGCGCLQGKIKKDDVAKVTMEWVDTNKENKEPITLRLTPEMVIKIFKRISDEDVYFMGFSPVWSRPEWMICQVMAVPPPTIRPSVKMDHQQRSEDDLSHILIMIIKTNKILQEKIASNSQPNIIEDWCSVLQYYVSTQIDNKIPGYFHAAQRSGRPLKSIKDRLNGKSGRMRSNLMAKRVDFSARSVITADPNISIRELGIPLKIAKNITKPIVVNKLNRQFLKKLVLNGPDVYPGAKIWEKKNGESITLRYIDRTSIDLEDGDIIHRHMLDGDPVLFNRQPSLHRMSMMAHIAKIMKKGDTFRLNVADTKPYNADFDGDEMNLHAPQNVVCDAELKMLAAVAQQIISPSSNSPIIGIYQDSMVGSYLFTSPNMEFSRSTAMNLLMNFNKVNIEFLEKDVITSNEILSQILPPISLKLKGASEISVLNGSYLHGQLDKGALNGSKGFINRICNDFGNMAASNFIDDLQNVVTSFLKINGFSVGINDLVTNLETRTKISDVIIEKNTSVNLLIEELQLSIFKNTTGKPNLEVFETKVNNILNQSTAETSKIAIDSLSKDNRFVIMFKAGSKGTELNISQMIACVGQQNVNGKRIPYGFEERTLPQFTKFDDTAKARGFVESSYINGLSPSELFFHAMGGRVGLIDTAVKTSTTGYIQRRLIKGLEDLVVNYDMSVRSNKHKIVQFLYGDDGIDPMRVENQTLELLEMNVESIYSHFSFPNDEPFLKDLFTPSTYKKYREENTKDLERDIATKMIQWRNMIMKNIIEYKSEKIVRSPVAFVHIINNISGQQGLNRSSVVDITPKEVFEICEKTLSTLGKMHYNSPTELFIVLFHFFLSPKELLFNRRFNRKSIVLLMEMIIMQYKRAIVAPGEMVGLVSAQSIGEPITQMTLNTFHFAGVSSKSNVTRGVPRLEEILTLSAEPKNPLLTVFLNPEDETNKDTATKIMHMIEYTILSDVVKSSSICFDPYDNADTVIVDDVVLLEQFKTFSALLESCGAVCQEEDTSKWVIRMVMDSEIMLEKNITMDDINFTLANIDGISCIFSDYNSDNLIFRIRLENPKKKKASLDQTDDIFLLKNFQQNLLKNVILRGVKGIKQVLLRKIKDNMVLIDTKYSQKEIWVIDGVGNNLLDVLGLEFIDKTRTTTNNIITIFELFGIEAARQAIYNELSEVIEFDGAYINYHHLSILIDRMTHNYKLVSIFRHGINNDNIGPIAKASFEETPEIFLRAAKHGELDTMRGVSANVMCGQEGLFGTNAFQLLIDMEMMRQFEVELEFEDSTQEMFQEKDVCSFANINIENNIDHIKQVQTVITNYTIDI